MSETNDNCIGKGYSHQPKVNSIEILSKGNNDQKSDNSNIIQYEEYQDNMFPKPSQPVQTFSLDFFSNCEEPEVRYDQDFSHIDEDTDGKSNKDYARPKIGGKDIIVHLFETIISYIVEITIAILKPKLANICV